MFRARLIPGLILLCACTLGLSAAPQQKAKDPDKLKERDRLLAEALQLQAAGKTKAAIAVVDKVLSLDRIIFGTEHWRTVDIRLTLADLDRVQSLTTKQRRELGDAGSLMDQAVKLQAQGNFEEARTHADNAYRIRLGLLGETSSLTISAYALATRLLAATGGLREAAPAYKKLVEAAPAYKKLVQTENKVFGQNHPKLAKTLTDFAVLYQNAQRLTDAEPLLRRALEIRRTTLGETHKDFLPSLHALAYLYQRVGDYARAEPLYTEERDLCLNAFGPEHTKYAVSLINLASLFVDQGDFEQAEPLLEKALGIFRKHADKRPDQLAVCLNNLANVHAKRRRDKEAEALYQEALQINKNVFGEKSPEVAGNLYNLAALYLSQENYSKAGHNFDQARSIYYNKFGERHPEYASCLDNLAVLHRAQGRATKAEELFQQILSIRRQTVGEKHHQYALALVELAILYKNQSDYAKAEPRCRQAIQILRPHLEDTAIVLSERRQLAHRNLLDPRVGTLLQVTEKLPATTTSTYDLLLTWKGSVTTRQRLARLSRGSSADDSEAKKLFEDLDDLSRQIAAWSLISADRIPEGVDVTTMLATLTAQRAQAEVRLTAHTAAFGSFRESRTLNSPGLQRLLPDGVVLVDFVIYKENLAAFVVTRDTLRRVELGKLRPIQEAIESFRTNIKRALTTPMKDDPAQVLRQKILDPLDTYLSNAKLVLIAPEGPLTQLPFAALPGKKPGTYLVEQAPLAVLPVPQMLPDLLAGRVASGESPTLLAVGDVDFDGDSAQGERKDAVASLLRAGSKQKWPRLPATLGEVVSIEKTFRAALPSGAPTILRSDEANETAVRRLAAGQNYLHFATHGFFAPEEIRSATQTRASGEEDGADRSTQVFGWDPQLLSGIVLAGANKPKPEDDGVLTAYELAGMDLERVELVVLSACETGLGKVAGGEGNLGLQRAFQIAGARTVISSLWSVSDEATRVLMERFYVNLWSKKMTKLEALREAQIWMLREGRQDVGVQRGIERLNPTERPDPNAPLPPYYWAAFVLSGDWR